MASDFLPCGTPCPVNTSNTPAFRDQRAVGAQRRAQHVSRAATSSSSRKAKSRFTACRSEASSAGLVRDLRLAGGTASR